MTLSKSKAQKKAQENISQFLKKLEEKGIQITDKNVMIEFADNKCQVSASITSVEKIGKYEPAEMKKISVDERQENDESD